MTGMGDMPIRHCPHTNRPWGTSVASNLTSHADGLAKYSDKEIVTMIAMGKRPNGSAMLPPMPYGYLAKMSDDNMAAIILYLHRLPPMADEK